MNVPSELKYARSDEWVRDDGDVIVIGITDYAQHELGEIVFVELPEAGSSIAPGAPFGVVESVKAVAELVSPVGGEVVEVNSPLPDTPSIINESPYENGWMIKIKAADKAPLSELLSAGDYAAYRSS
jgi:glycine cleavage system H protein